MALVNKPELELSPLLKFYNELNEHSNFRLPVKSLLEFDARLFRAQLSKIKRSYKIQMNYIKQAAKDRANDYLMGQFEKTRKLLMTEFKHLMHETEMIRDENGKYMKMLQVANDKIER